MFPSVKEVLNLSVQNKHDYSKTRSKIIEYTEALAQCDKRR